MLQPFIRLLPVFVQKLEAINQKYIVTQSYKAGKSVLAEREVSSILVSVYDDLGLAKTHWNAVREDAMAAIIDLNKPAHKEKLYEMLSGSKYLVYWSVVKDAAALEKRINAKYRDNMRRYIEKNTTWKIARDATLRPSIQLVFGELYINLKYGSQLIRVKFEEIEKV